MMARESTTTSTANAEQETHSIFSVDLGNLEAHTEAVVRLSYLRQLDRVAGAVEFCHTATWVPPYTDAAGDRVDGGNEVCAAECHRRRPRPQLLGLQCHASNANEPCVFAHWARLAASCNAKLLPEHPGCATA